ncbi:hypothetical protein MTR67_038888, partial [Solanum verrucosum]
IRAYVFWCFDDLLTSAGTWSSAEYARPVTKCGTAVKVVCVRELVKAAEYFTNQKQGCCLYVCTLFIFCYCNCAEDLVPSRLVDAYIPTSGIRACLFSLVNTKKRKDPDGMAAPPNMEEGQSSTRPPRFNGQYYGWDLVLCRVRSSSDKVRYSCKSCCVRELVKAAEYFTNQKQGCCFTLFIFCYCNCAEDLVPSRLVDAYIPTISNCVYRFEMITNNGGCR